MTLARMTHARIAAPTARTLAPISAAAPRPGDPHKVPPEIDPPGQRPAAPEPREDPRPIGDAPKGPEVMPTDPPPRPSPDPGSPNPGQ